MVCVLLAEGFEEVEALTPADLLRRAGVEVQLVGVTGNPVRGAHGIAICTDCTIDEANVANADMIVLPGGMPGTKHLYADARVTAAVQAQYERGKYVAAICAAPSVVLGGMGLLHAKKATCYPGMEQGMTGAIPVAQNCVVDGNIITGRGVGGALDFSCALVAALCGEDKAREVAEAVVHHVGK
ncbi:DJ-1 family glyoxalase III [Agathobaculum sp.]|uniref:DJ-1 family glyoxalase III n=1 Tax=Agathobaculum sp. TaxID=2048138 RepID=UPI002A82208D|nr:DJ-1 family glyoxalase III [Agathobaculum sp.]MDY3618882.1 DJ-1 family glyoxalase III [Agathobaculum sp.]